MTGTRARLLNWLRQPVSAASLTVFRTGFGLLMCLALIRFWARGWIEAYFCIPDYFFSYPGLEWIQPLAGQGMYGHLLLLIAASLLLAGGYFWPWPALAFCLGFSWLELIDRTTYLNHYYAISLLAFMLIWLPRPRLQGQIPRWALFALQVQIACIYIYAGLAKVNPDWLVQAQPLRAWLQSQSQFPVIGPLLAWPVTAWIFAWAGMLFDLSIPFWLSWRPSRYGAYGAVVVFHLLTACLFPIGIFPWVMLLLALIFFEPDWPLKIWAKSKPEAVSGKAVEKPSLLGLVNWPVEKLSLLVLSLHLFLQLILPWRYLLYPGNLLWHEQGFDFSWRVMLIEKTGLLEYNLWDPLSRQKWVIHPREYLTGFQTKIMATRPILIHQFAHELGRRWHAKGYSQIEVRAESWASLNGRPSQRLIDPQANLLATPLPSFLEQRALPFIVRLED